MSKRIALAAVAAGALIPAAPASAHVTLQPNEAPAGGFTRIDVRVPNERDEAGTSKVRVQFPPGFLFLSYEPEQGWKVAVAKRKLAEPAELFGEKINEEVGEVTFTATKGNEIAPGQFRDFGLSLRMPEKAGTALTFKALQTYENGEVVRWIGPPDADEPAPQVKLTAAQEEGAAPAPAAAATATEDEGESEDGPSTGLVIAALVLGGLGLVAGGAALASARRRA